MANFQEQSTRAVETSVANTSDVEAQTREFANSREESPLPTECPIGPVRNFLTGLIRAPPPSITHHPSGNFEAVSRRRFRRDFRTWGALFPLPVAGNGASEPGPQLGM